MAETYKIGEAAKLLNLKTYVLRFWETEFPQITPLRTDKGQRLYSCENIELLKRVQYLLHDRGLTIEGARRILEEGQNGAAHGKTDRFSVVFAPEAASFPAPSQPPVLKSDKESVQAEAGHGESPHVEKAAQTHEISPVPPSPSVAYQEIIQELEEVAALLRTKPIMGNIKE